MPVITVRDLGNMGRAGNAMFLYVFAKAYSEAMGCDLQTSDWWGRKVFVHAHEPIVNVHLPQTEKDSESSKPLLYFNGQKNIDIKVFAQHQVYLDFYTREKAREWLRIKPEYERYGPDQSRAYSAAHLRRGDYVTDPWLRQHYCEVSDLSYDRAVEKFQIPQPLFKVFEGWRESSSELNEHGIGWLPDFLLLRGASHLLRGNSSFSVWAAWLGFGKVYSPAVGNRVGLQDVEFTEGNHENTAGGFRNQSDLYLRET